MIPKKQKGFIAVITVLMILVFSLSIVVGTAYLSIGSAQSARILSEGEEALQLTEGCAEDALLHGVRDENYTGGSYEYLGGRCNVNITKDGQIWMFDISGTKNVLKRSVEIIATRQIIVPATFVLQSWHEN